MNPFVLKIVLFPKISHVELKNTEDWFLYWFKICDATNYHTIISCIGNMVMVVVCLFLGPAPFLNLSPEVGLIQGMAGLGGIGYAFVMVSTFSRAQAEVLKKGFSDDIETYLMISGMN